MCLLCSGMDKSQAGEIKSDPRRISPLPDNKASITGSGLAFI